MYVLSGAAQCIPGKQVFSLGPMGAVITTLARPLDRLLSLARGGLYLVRPRY